MNRATVDKIKTSLAHKGDEELQRIWKKNVHNDDAADGKPELLEALIETLQARGMPIGDGGTPDPRTPSLDEAAKVVGFCRVCMKPYIGKNCPRCRETKETQVATCPLCNNIFMYEPKPGVRRITCDSCQPMGRTRSTPLWQKLLFVGLVVLVTTIVRHFIGNRGGSKQAASAHTELTVHGKNSIHIDPAELKQLARMLGLSVAAVTTTPQGVLVKFSGELSQNERQSLTTSLDRAIRVDPPEEAPTFHVVITEADMKVLDVLGLERGGRYAIVLDVNSGRHGLFTPLLVPGHGTSGHVCAYAFKTMGEVPTLTYEKNAFGVGIAGIAEHHFVGSPVAFQTAADRLRLFELHGEKTAAFVFWEPGKGGSSSKEESEECAARILNGSSDAFFGSLMFPTLSLGLSSYSFNSAGGDSE